MHAFPKQQIIVHASNTSNLTTNRTWTCQKVHSSADYSFFVCVSKKKEKMDVFSSVFLFLFLAFLFMIFLSFVPSGNVSKRNFEYSLFHFNLLMSCCPVFGALICIFISIFIYPNETLSTHCGVDNFWPSISSAVGNMSPQTYIWRFAVAIHNTSTITDSFALYHYLKVHLNNRMDLLCRFCAFWRGCSAFFLFLLTFVSSRENFAVHQTGFVLWVAFGSLALISFLFLWDMGEKKSSFGRKWLWTFTLSYFFLLILSMFLYYIHNAFCWPYVYSFFGICEFLLMLSYVLGVGWGFHMAFDTTKKKIAWIDVE